MTLVPTDVPVHRGSVGAMGVAMGSQQPENESRFRPYVWKGKPPKVETKPKPDPEAQRRRDVARMKRQAKKNRQARLVAKWQAQRAEAARRQARLEAEAAVSQKLQQEYDDRPLAPVIPLFPRGAPPVEAPAPGPVRRSPAPWVSSRPKGPSPGWKAPTGADLDGWLDD